MLQPHLPLFYKDHNNAFQNYMTLMICIKRHEIAPICKLIKSYKADKLLLNDYVNNYRSQIKDNTALHGPDNPLNMESLSVLAHSLLTA